MKFSVLMKFNIYNIANQLELYRLWILKGRFCGGWYASNHRDWSYQVCLSCSDFAIKNIKSIHQ